MMNFTYEKRFLDFLGYKTKPSVRRNILNIIDANNQLVGSVNNYCDGLRYELRIKRDNCRLLMQRSVDPELYKGLSTEEKYDNLTTYQFTVTFNKETSYRISLDLSEEPFLSISTYEGKRIGCLILGKDLLSLELLTDTENYNICESIKVKLDGDSQEEDKRYIHKGLAYIYDLAFAPYKEPLTLKDSKNVKVYSLKASRMPKTNRHPEDSLCIITSTWDGQQGKNIKDITSGTISEVIAKNELALSAFNRFRHLINEIIPNNKDLIISLANCQGELPYPTTLFIPELLPEIDLSTYDSVISINDKIKLGFTREVSSSNRKTSHIDIICSNGSLYDFGSATLIDIDNLDTCSIIDTYENYLLKYSDGVNLDRAFDMDTESDITDLEELNKINSRYIRYKRKVLENTK